MNPIRQIILDTLVSIDLDRVDKAEQKINEYFLSIVGEDEMKLDAANTYNARQSDDRRIKDAFRRDVLRQELRQAIKGEA